MMKKSLVYLLLFLQFNMIYCQLNLKGEAYYQLNILGAMKRCSGGCGDIDGLRSIKIFDENGSSYDIYNGRKIYQDVNHVFKFTEKNKINRVLIHKIIRWETLFSCDGGPDDRYNDIYLPSTCFSYYSGHDGGDGLFNLTITSKPVIILDSPKNLYFGDQENLNIEIPNNIDKKYFNWKFKVGDGVDQNIPVQFNNKNILSIKGEDFLKDEDFGKNVSVWVEMNCSAGTELAKGYDRIAAYYEFQNCLRDGGIFNIFKCLADYQSKLTYISNNPTPSNLPNLQSNTSNALTFTYLKSAPKVQSIQVNPAKCSYSSDGELFMKFDRKTISDEKLTILLKNISKVGSDPVSYDVVLDDQLNCKIDNLDEGDYELVVWGSYKNQTLYSFTQNNPLKFKISKPAPVTFQLTKTDIWCHGGQDGVIKIEAAGGNPLSPDDVIFTKNTKAVPRYYYSLDNGLTWKGFTTEFVHNLTNLPLGTYTIQVKDWKGCNALQSNGDILKQTVTITQPKAPVSLSYTLIKQPTFYGGTNGKLVAAIKGGTLFDDHSYTYEWRNSKGVLQTTITPYYEANSQTYNLTLDGIPSDTYTLTVRDKNFTSATDKDGCTVVNSTQFLDQPDPIVVKLNVQRTISCNVTNTFGNEADLDPVDGQRDESQDGILQATVTGGVRFTGFENNGLPYKFIWRKQKSDGSWEIWNDQDATAQYLNHGNYSLNVEDKNGIRLGVYVNNVLSEETPVIQLMAQPSKLELQFLKGDISCSAGNNGWIKAVPTGGTPPYNYEWTTGATTAQISNLIANNYFVKITDAKGCFVQGSMLINQPNGVEITGAITSPTCHNGRDGRIETTITGGTPPYTYTWSNGATSPICTDLVSGNYTLTLVDAQGCTYFKDFLLENPAPIEVKLGEDRTLCNGQQLDLDITIPDALAQYSWTSSNGFSATHPKVSLTQAGTYTAKVTSSKGCIGEDSILVKTNQVAISSEFFLTSQAYLNDEVILINASNPLGENTSWEIPNSVTIVHQNEKYIVLKFTNLGSYTISLKQTQGDCYALYSKTITVEPKTIDTNIGNVAQPFITDFLVTPNPSNGDFQAIVKLAETSPIKLRLYPINGQQPLVEKKENGQKSYVIEFNSALPTGTYALILETAKQTLVKKIIIY